MEAGGQGDQGIVTDPRRRIPAVDTLLESEAFRALMAEAGRAPVLAAVRAIQDGLRGDLESARAAGERLDEPRWYADRVRERLARGARPSLAPVINATGVVLHTNLGRAPLARAAREAVQAAASYATLEYDPDSGTRGSRYDHCIPLLRELTGAEDALVVNNNAGAVVLALNTLAEGRVALISRGELVEIGGSFRIPEIMARSGARMGEVGATNRTHAADYRDALDDQTGLVLKVHRSNFRVEGFTAEVDEWELAAIAREAGVPFVHDLGSGAILDLTRFGLPPEPTAGMALEHGADLVTMSGDKLLGGPQAGIVLGRAALVERLRRNPLCRAMRPDKLTLAALEATLALYRDPDRAVAEVPVLRMVAADREGLRERAARLASVLEDRDVDGEPVDVADAVGGGAYPGVELPGAAVAVHGPAEALARALRLGEPRVVARVRDGRVLLHVRTVESAEEPPLAAAVQAALEGIGPEAGGPAAMPAEAEGGGER